MPYKTDKNIITYTGNLYQIVADINTGTITTNHPKQKNYIVQVINKPAHCPSDLIAKTLMEILYYADGHMHPFIETMVKCLNPNLMQWLKQSIIYNYRWHSNIDALIETIKKNWYKVLQINDNAKVFLNRVNRITPFALDILIEEMDLFDLNETEREAYQVIPNKKFVKTFAGQIKMYQHIIYWSDFRHIMQKIQETELEPKSYKNKNLLETIKNIMLDYENYKNELNEIMFNKNYYLKYKWLENTNTDGWTFSLLKNIQNIKEEAELMDNCLYRSYFERILTGESIIVVAISPDGNRIDLELNEQNQLLVINQAYYKGDVRLSQEDRNFLNQWCKNLDGNKK